MKVWLPRCFHKACLPQCCYSLHADSTLEKWINTQVIFLSRCSTILSWLNLLIIGLLGWYVKTNGDDTSGRTTPLNTSSEAVACNRSPNTSILIVDSSQNTLSGSWCSPWILNEPQNGSYWIAFLMLFILKVIPANGDSVLESPHTTMAIGMLDVPKWCALSMLCLVALSKNKWMQSGSATWPCLILNTWFDPPCHSRAA